MAEPAIKAESNTVQCSAAGCERGARAKGWCGKHYQRLHNRGTLDPYVRPKPLWKTCSLDGCPNRSRTRTGRVCEVHYYRYRRTGKYHAPVYGTWSVNSNGYEMRTDRVHPIRSAQGYLYRHRMVLYDAIGPGAHACHWCSCDIEWNEGGARQLVVDHLDNDKRNNDQSNLVPSCHRCNSTRGLFVSWVQKHRDDPFLKALFAEATDNQP